MKSLYTLVSLTILTLTAKAQILVSNTTSTTGSSYYYGQSFTTPDDGTADELSGFAWLLGTTSPRGAGNLYLFTEAYTGTPTDLSSAGALAVGAWNSTTLQYDFSLDSITLQPDTEYYVYSDSKVLVRWNGDGTDVLPGGDEYMTSIAGNDYAIVPNNDTTFEVLTPAPAPEPSTIALGCFAAVIVFAMRKVLHPAKTTVRR